MNLSDTAIRSAKLRSKDYKLFDEGGLYLLITPNGVKRWRFKYCFEGKKKLLALGGYPAVPLKEARQRRLEAKEKFAMGNCPQRTGLQPYSASCRVHTHDGEVGRVS